MSSSIRKVFICYRRIDNPDFAERIRDKFITHYQRENVFMDFDSIPPFTKFADYIREKVVECDVLIAVIGPRWLELLQEKAKRFQDDYVRIEIGLALQEGKLVAPICIKGAAIPALDEIPPELKSMFDYHVAVIDSGINFLENIDRIVDAVEQELARRANTPKLKNSPKKRTEQHKNRFNHEQALLFTSRGQARLEAGDIDGAIADFTEAIQINPNDTLAHASRGNAHYAKGNMEVSITDFTEVIRLNPEDPVGYVGRSNAYNRQGNFDDAIADFTEVIRLTPDDPIGYVGRSNARRQNGDTQGAVTDLDRAMRLNHEHGNK